MSPQSVRHQACRKEICSGFVKRCPLVTRSRTLFAVSSILIFLLFKRSLPFLISCTYRDPPHFKDPYRTGCRYNHLSIFGNPIYRSSISRSSLDAKFSDKGKDAATKIGTPASRGVIQNIKNFFPPPLRPEDDPCQNGKEHCVVSFAVYGNDSFYLSGGLRNIQLGRIYWPGWTVRFYTDESLPKSYVRELDTPTSEVIIVNDVKGHIAGMFWRLFVANDPKVDRFIIRDIDSAPGSRERRAIDEWIQSRRRFHLFRDAAAHTGWPIVGCCWGAARPYIPKRGEYERGPRQEGVLPYEAVEGPIRRGEVDHMMIKKGGDQDFLRDYVWPLMSEDELISHDAYHCKAYPATKAFPTPRKGPCDSAARIYHAPKSNSGSVDLGSEEHLIERFWFERYIEKSGCMPPWATCPLECRPPDHPEWIYC